MNLAEKINERLASLDKTWYWLAKETGIHKNALYPMKYGKQKGVTLKTAVRIAVALDMDMNEFKDIDF